MLRALCAILLGLCACGASSRPEKFSDAAPRSDSAPADAFVPTTPDATPAATYQIDPETTQALPPRGGGGGDEFSLECEPGSLAVGLAGRSGSEIDQIALLCAPLAEDGTLGAITQTESKGGGGGDEFSDTCDDGEALVGLSGRSGARIDRVQGFCASLDPWIELGMGGGVLPAHGGDGGDEFNDTCDQSSFIFGLDGRSGSRVDQIQVRCVAVEKL